MRSRLMFLAVGLVVGVLGTCAAVWANGFRGHVETDGATIGTTTEDIVSDAPHSLQIAGLCLSGADHAKITGVRALKGYGDLVVTDFTMAPLQSMGNNRAETLDAYVESVEAPRSGPKTRHMSTQCSDDYDYGGLVVELRAPARTELPVAASGFVIDYKVKGISKSVEARTAFSFCAGDDRDDVLVDVINESGESLNLYDCQP